MPWKHNNFEIATFFVLTRYKKSQKQSSCENKKKSMENNEMLCVCCIKIFWFHEKAIKQTKTKSKENKISVGKPKNNVAKTNRPKNCTMSPG